LLNADLLGTRFKTLVVNFLAVLHLAIAHAYFRMLF
jgi:hypothetical protein